MSSRRRGRASLIIAVTTASASLATLLPSIHSAGAASGVRAVADATVTERKPTTNFGASDVLRASSNPTVRSYIRFDLSTVDYTSERVSLRVIPVESDAQGFKVKSLEPNRWQEATITYENAPAPGALIASSGRLIAGTPVDVDVSPLVSGGSRTVEMVLEGPRLAKVVLGSRESSAGGPQLVFVPPPVPTPSPSPSPSRAEPSPSPTPTPSPDPSPSPSPPPAPPAKVFAYYYLWWTTRHWQDKLGPNYPYDVSPLPLPATLAADGCSPRSLFEGNHLTDVPPRLYTQDDASVIIRHVRQAARAGLAGFIVNWRGTGVATQTVDDVGYNQRLQALVDAVHLVNAEGIPFKLWISYKASDTVLTTSYIINDLAYLDRRYGADPAFDRTFSPRTTLVWMGSRKYGIDVIRTVSEQSRSGFFLVGDENWNSWTSERAKYLDGVQYYWSSQSPYTNPMSFSQLQTLASTVRSGPTNPDGTRKMWFAPVAPGYDSILNGGSTCVPRNDGATMRMLFEGNGQSRPDAWALISWNEISEATYVEPLQRYGTAYLDELRELIATAA